MTVSKTLLMTATPPGGRNVGEIVLRDLCSLLPSEKVHVFSAGSLEPQDSPYVTCTCSSPPNEQAWRPFPGRGGGFMNRLHVQTGFKRGLRQLIHEAVEFGTQCEVERIWLVLNSLTLIGAGSEIARQLNVPLRTLVWDPPSYLCKQMMWDKYSTAWLMKCFGKALRHSEKVMVVSEEMKQKYEAEYGSQCVIVRHFAEGQPECRKVPESSSDPFRIGFAGTLYDDMQLTVLLNALHQLRWSIRGRTVRLRMLCNQLRLKKVDFPCEVEYLGRRTSEEEVRGLLCECDVNYLPISFRVQHRELAQYSFPTKLGLYLSTGRPVLAHGPEYSSSIHFCQTHQLGAQCTSQDPQVLAGTIVDLLSETDFYDAAVQNVETTREACFSREVMEKEFMKFMDDQSV